MVAADGKKSPSKKHESSNERIIVSPENGSIYVTHAVLGSGSSGTVYEGVRQADGLRVAVKVIGLSHLRFSVGGDAKAFAAEKSKLLREVKILRQLDHPGVVKLYDVVEVADTLNMVMEYIDGGELFARITEDAHFQDLGVIKFVFVQVADALLYLHANSVIHRDVKPENVLLFSDMSVQPSWLKDYLARVKKAQVRESDGQKSDGQKVDGKKAIQGDSKGSIPSDSVEFSLPIYPIIRLVDFGLSKSVKGGATMARSWVGTPQYWAPEVIKSATLRKEEEKAKEREKDKQRQGRVSDGRPSDGRPSDASDQSNASSPGPSSRGKQTDDSSPSSAGWRNEKLDESVGDTDSSSDEYDSEIDGFEVEEDREESDDSAIQEGRIVPGKAGVIKTEAGKSGPTDSVLPHKPNTPTKPAPLVSRKRSPSSRSGRPSFLSKSKSLIHYDGRVDIWSLGVMLYVCLCRRYPFTDGEGKSMTDKILAGEFGYERVTKPVPQTGKDLIEKMVRVNPEERILLEKVFSHPFLADFLPAKRFAEIWEPTLPDIDPSESRLNSPSKQSESLAQGVKITPILEPKVVDVSETKAGTSKSGQVPINPGQGPSKSGQAQFGSSGVETGLALVTPEMRLKQQIQEYKSSMKPGAVVGADAAYIDSMAYIDNMALSLGEQVRDEMQASLNGSSDSSLLPNGAAGIGGAPPMPAGNRPDLNQLATSQLDILRCILKVYAKVRHEPVAAEVMLSLFGRVKKIHFESMEGVGRFAVTAGTAVDVMEDSRCFALSGQADRAVECLEDMKKAVSAMTSIAKSVQSRYKGLIDELMQFDECARLLRYAEQNDGMSGISNVSNVNNVNNLGSAGIASSNQPIDLSMRADSSGSDLGTLTNNAMKAMGEGPTVKDLGGVPAPKIINLAVEKLTEKAGAEKFTVGEKVFAQAPAGQTPSVHTPAQSVTSSPLVTSASTKVLGGVESVFGLSCGTACNVFTGGSNPIGAGAASMAGGSMVGAGSMTNPTSLASQFQTLVTSKMLAVRSPTLIDRHNASLFASALIELRLVNEILERCEIFWMNVQQNLQRFEEFTAGGIRLAYGSGLSGSTSASSGSPQQLDPGVERMRKRYNDRVDEHIKFWSGFKDQCTNFARRSQLAIQKASSEWNQVRTFIDEQYIASHANSAMSTNVVVEQVASGRSMGVPSVAGSGSGSSSGVASEKSQKKFA